MIAKGFARRIGRILPVVVLALTALTMHTIAQTTPFATTQPATSITGTTATLNGMAVPNGLPSNAWFEWGTRGNYDQYTSLVGLGTGMNVNRVSQEISGLTNQGVYQFRLVVSNAVGVTYGAIQLFTTGRRMVGWGANGQLGRFAVAPTNVVAMAGGGSSGLAVTAENSVAVYWPWSGGTGPSFSAVAQPVLTNVLSVSVGENFSLALLANGTVTAWGGNGQGQTNVPVGLTNVALVYGGPRYGLALRNDGSVAAWGEWTSVPINPVWIPAGLSNVVGLAGGLGHCVALLADGTVQAWGDNYYGQVSVPQDLSNVVAVAAGHYFSLALQSNGTVVKWPGSFSSFPTYSPPKIVASNAVAIAASYTGGLALLGDGTVMGLDSLTNVPSGFSNVVAIANGYFAGYALGPSFPPAVQAINIRALANSQIVVSLQALDPNGDVQQFRIVSLPAAGNLYQYAGGSPGPAITLTNTVVTDSGGRVIFVPTTNEFGEPYAVFDYLANDGESDSLPAAVTITVSGKSYALTQPATMLDLHNALLSGVVVPNGLPTTAWFEWGIRGSFDRATTPENAGAGTSAQRFSSPVGSLAAGIVYQARVVASNASAVVYGAPRFFGFSGKGKIAAWGNNLFGQTNVPIGATNIVAVAAGVGDHSLALKADGSVIAWGSNNLGQTNVPVGLSNVVAVAGGGDQSLALKADGTVVAWGANSSRQATVPTGLSNVVAVAGGRVHSLALLVDGKFVGWGNNTAGKTSNPLSLSNSIAGATAGGDHNVALRANGTVYAWGLSSFGATIVPAGLSNVVAIGAGGNNSYAVQANGALTGWGDNFFGQSNPPAGLSNVHAVAGGYAHVVALADNLAPTASARNLAGYPNHDSLIQFQGTDGNGDLLSYRIASLPAAGTLYQFVAGNRGPEISDVNAAVSDSGGRVLFAPTSNAIGSPYTSFTYIANDGEADSTPATVTVDIIVPPAPQFNATAVSWSSNGSLQLNFSGDANASYRLWASSNLVNWAPLGIAQPISNGWFQFTDYDATNFPQRFYKAGAP